MENVLDKVGTVDFSGAISNCSRLCSRLIPLISGSKVIEIGTAYGIQLKEFQEHCSEIVCVDPMYDWVPDVHPESGFDTNLVDQAKISKWNSETEVFKDKMKLIIQSSYSVHERYNETLTNSDVLIIDGCHHPAEHVLLDFTNFRKFMRPKHYVIWDDMDMSDVASACVKAHEMLITENIKVVRKDFGHVAVFFVDNTQSAIHQ